MEVFREDDDGRFCQTPMSDSLRSGAYVRPWAIMLGSPFVWRPWGQLYDGVMTGQCAFDDVFATTFGEYMAAHPDEAEAYNAAMDMNASTAVSAVVAAYDFSAFDTIVDIGGGRGALLAGILEANPETCGVLFDLPGVVADTEKLQVTRLGARCKIEGGDFFDHVPAGDALVLKSIVHGLSDGQARQLLANCGKSLYRGGKIILVENVLGHSQDVKPQNALMDLMMFTLTRGQERTADEFDRLLQEAGFELLRIIPTERGNSVIEARRAKG